MFQITHSLFKQENTFIIKSVRKISKGIKLFLFFQLNIIAPIAFAFISKIYGLFLSHLICPTPVLFEVQGFLSAF